jgi:hypothetical protein
MLLFLTSVALAVGSKGKILEAFLKKAGTEYCDISADVTDEEAVATLDVVSILVPLIDGTLDSISAIKSDFDSIVLATGIVQSAIKNLGSQADTLINCLVKKGSRKAYGGY